MTHRPTPTRDDRSRAGAAGQWAVEELDRDLFRGRASPSRSRGEAAARTLAQSLLAAGRTTGAGLIPRSLRAAHVRPPDPARATVFEVSRDLDAPDHADRRVVALQDARVVLSLSASFGRPPDPGARSVESHERVPPGVLPEVTLDPLPGVSMRVSARHGVLPSLNELWLQRRSELPDDPVLHAAVLAYVTDAFPSGALESQGTSADRVLDHSVWFHRPSRLDEWVRVDVRAQRFGGEGRLSSGSVVTPHGDCVASFVRTTTREEDL